MIHPPKGKSRMNYWTKRFSHGQQAQGLDDLEDILNSPAPALDSTTVDRHQSSSTVWSETASPLDRNALADSTDSDSATAQPAQGQSVNSTASKVLEPDQLSQLRRCANTDATEPRRPSVWSSAYQSASAPLTAAWTHLPEKLHNLSSFSVLEKKSEGHSASQYLLDLMAKNKAATAAATVAGAAAGGAVAGPFGMAAGAKTGALMVAVGAAAAGAAQHYYLPVASDTPVAASAASQPDSPPPRPV